MESLNSLLVGLIWDVWPDQYPMHASPFRIWELNEEDYANAKVVCQDDILTLYTSDHPGKKYELVLKVETGSTCKRLSIHRSSDAIDVQVFYLQLQEKLPQLFQCLPHVEIAPVPLSKIIQTIKENPSWLLAHVIAHLGYLDCLKSEFIQCQMNDLRDCSWETSPLHIAVKAQRLEPVKVLIEQNAPLNAKDEDGNTALHYAALNDPESTQLTELLVDKGSDVNQQNLNGDSPLHLTVRNNYFSSAVVLLIKGANVNLCNSDGDTPLHLAVKLGNIPLVQALIVFGADLNMYNYQGETPRHIVATSGNDNSGELLYCLHAVGATRCTEPTHACNEGCSIKGQFNGIPYENCKCFKTTETMLEELLLSVGYNPNTRSGRRDGYRVLCLDGGGIRGMVLIQMLSELEKVLGKPVIQCFDFIAGTSTGGILALVMASGKMIDECRSMYFSLKGKVFVGLRPYDTDTFETFLKKELGETTMMSDIKEPMVMITATRGDRQPSNLHIFRNYSSPLEILRSEERDSLTDEVLPDSKKELIWQVARATGAAPTYFSPFGRYIDGGFIANNPTMDALTEIHQRNEAFIASGQQDQVRTAKVVLSLGCGRRPLVATTPVDVSFPTSISDAFRVAEDVSVLIQLLVDQASQTDGRVTARTQAFCKMLEIPYFRMNPQISEHVPLDETKTEILVKMLWETTAYMRCIRPELEKLKEFLV